MPIIKDPRLIEVHARRIYGCSNAEALRANDGRPLRERGTKAYAYVLQRTVAIGRRKIAWRISFPDWIAIWEESGKWHLRGRCRGQYVMSRHGDVGPYHKDNVEITTCSWNSSTGRKRRKSQTAVKANDKKF